MYVTYMIMKSNKLLNTTGYITTEYIIIKYCIFFLFNIKITTVRTNILSFTINYNMTIISVVLKRS